MPVGHQQRVDDPRIPVGEGPLALDADGLAREHATEGIAVAGIPFRRHHLVEAPIVMARWSPYHCAPTRLIGRTFSPAAA